MATSRLSTRKVLRQVLTIRKEKNEQQLSSNLTVPVWNKYLQSLSSISSDPVNIHQGSQSTIYALGPPKKFDFSHAQKLLQLELNRSCMKVSSNARYDSQLSHNLAHDLAQQLRQILKPDYLHCLRYKIIVLVSIVQTIPNRQIHQSMAIASRCLWNQDTDGSVTAQTKLGHDMLAIATAFVLYAE